MATISLCMIVKNEEAVLGRCLDSAAGLVDEIVVVDTGSTDATREIATRYADRVCEFAWIDDFAAARNFAFAQASMEYCMWLDADDVFLEEDHKAFLNLKETLDPTVSVVMAPYHTGFDERGRVTFSYYRERLIKNRAGMCWVGAVHEVVTPVGPVLGFRRHPPQDLPLRPRPEPAYLPGPTGCWETAGTPSAVLLRP
mgnify:CR=1 FL=1